MMLPSALPPTQGDRLTEILCAQIIETTGKHIVISAISDIADITISSPSSCSKLRFKLELATSKRSNRANGTIGTQLLQHASSVPTFCPETALLLTSSASY